MSLKTILPKGGSSESQLYDLSNKHSTLIIRRLIAYFPLLFFASLIAIKVSSWQLYWELIGDEDSVAEDLTFFVYIGTMLATLYLGTIYHKAKQKSVSSVLFVLAIGFFVIAMEEVSWFQRILDIQSPEIFIDNNKQAEINFHNLKYFPLHTIYMLVGFYGAFASILARKLKEWAWWSILLIPDRTLYWYFFPTFIFYFCLEYANRLFDRFLGVKIPYPPHQYGWIIVKDQEPIELLLGIGFLIHILLVIMQVMRYQKAKITEGLSP